METLKDYDHVETILGLIEHFQKSTNTRYIIDGTRIGIADIANIAKHDFADINITVDISENARRKLIDNAAYLRECLDKKMIIYGVNTGYGGSADVRNENIIENQKALVVHLNCGSLSQCLEVGHVRAAMFIRANSLSRGYSGVRPEVVDLLCGMINNDIVPQVPLRGSVSASGDLLHLSYIAACMNGSKQKSKVYYKGFLNKTAESAFCQAGLKFMEFQAKEALAVTNSASCASTLAAINLFHFGYSILLTELITAMSVECLKGHVESFHPTVYKCLPHTGMKQFSSSLNRLLEKSQFAKHSLDKVLHFGNKISEDNELAQDRYALRTSPQWLAPCIETWNESIRRIEVELNSSNDNPLIDHVQGQILHCGNFQGSSITVAMDQTRQSIQMCGRLIFAQLSEIHNHHMNNGLPPNLSGCDYTKDFGFKGIDVALAAYTSELDFLSGPMTNHVMSAEMHNQSINSMAMVSARKTAETLELLHLMISSSLISLCQAIDLRWIESEINRIWTNITTKIFSKEISMKNQSWKWYDAAFRFDHIVSQVRETNSFKQATVNGQNTNDLINSLINKFHKEVNSLVTLLNNGQQIERVSQMLGIGTRKMYEYVRRTLGIKFYNGTETLDSCVEKILEALKERSILNVISDIFNCCD